MGEQYLVSGNLYLSSVIPKVFCDVGNDYSYSTVAINVYAGGKEIFSASLYVVPEMQGVEFRIDDLVHSYMRNNELVCEVFQIDFATPEGTGIDTVTANIIFYAAHSVIDAQDLMHDTFLSNIDAMLVPEWYRSNLSLFNPFEDNQNLEIWVTPKGKQPVLADDELIATPGLNTYTIDLREIKQRGIDNRVLQESDTPAVVRIVCGHRCMSLYVKDELPSAAITFRNGYNVIQTIYFFGSWTEKFSTEASTATISRKLSQYDLAVESSYEILSHPISAADMTYYRFIGMSPSVSVILFSGRQALIFEGIITESSAETAPHQENMEPLKLTVRSSQSYCILTVNNSDYRIFNDIFNNSFI